MIDDQTMSDLFVNLAAGWSGAAFVLPITFKGSFKLNVTIIIEKSGQITIHERNPI